VVVVDQVLLGAGVLGDSLGSLADCVFGQFSRKQQSYSGLDLSAADCRSLVVVGQSGSLSCNSLEDVIHKAVHD